jgi:hypothetical protein
MKLKISEAGVDTWALAAQFQMVVPKGELKPLPVVRVAFTHKLLGVRVTEFVLAIVVEGDKRPDSVPVLHVEHNGKRTVQVQLERPWSCVIGWGLSGVFVTAAQGGYNRQG